MSVKTIFESDILNLAKNIQNIGPPMQLIKMYGEDGIIILQQCDSIQTYLDNSIKHMIKYEKFLKEMKEKFAYDIKYGYVMSKINYYKTSVNQLRLNVANSEFTNIKEKAEEMQEEYAGLRKCFAPIMSLPYVVDFSSLSKSDLRLIGIPGVHHESKIFLSYPFRDSNPTKDENQKLIDDYLIPLLKYVNIQPITARSELGSQDLIDDKIINLIKDCDGIIGFYTKNDSVENIEHELSANKNIIAICQEEGAKAPSMRSSRLMLKFNRVEMGYLVLELLKNLKNKKMFYLTI